MVTTSPRSLEDDLREQTELAEIGVEYERASEGLVGAAHVEACAAGAQYRLLHRMWQLADEAGKQLWRVERRWLRPGANALEPSSPEAQEQTLLDVADEVGPALRLPPSTAVARVRDAVLLAEALPAVLTALEAGDIGHTQTRVLLELWQELVEGARGLPPDQRPPVDAVQRVVDELLDRAPEATAAQLRALARARRARLLRASEEARHRVALADRRVWVEPQPDGMALLCALLDAATAAAVQDRVATLVGRAARRPVPRSGRDVAGNSSHPVRAAVESRPLRTVGPVAAVDPAPEQNPSADGVSVAEDSSWDAAEGDARTLGQWRADVLADLLLDGELVCWPERLRGVRGHVSVTVPALALLEHTGTLPADVPVGTRGGAGCAELAGYGPIPVSVPARIAAGAPSWTRVLTHPLTGVVLDHDRTTYAVPSDLARVLRARDGTCRFPGCRRAAARCDVDHTVAWADGGATASDNLAHLCRRHHLLKHKNSPLGRWLVRQESTATPDQRRNASASPAPPGRPEPADAAEGVLIWTSPAGRVHRTYPALSSRPAPEDPPPF